MTLILFNIAKRSQALHRVGVKYHGLFFSLSNSAPNFMIDSVKFIHEGLNFKSKNGIDNYRPIYALPMWVLLYIVRPYREQQCVVARIAL